MIVYVYRCRLCSTVVEVSMDEAPRADCPSGDVLAADPNIAHRDGCHPNAIGVLELLGQVDVDEPGTVSWGTLQAISEHGVTVTPDPPCGEPGPE